MLRSIDNGRKCILWFATSHRSNFNVFTDKKFVGFFKLYFEYSSVRKRYLSMLLPAICEYFDFEKAILKCGIGDN